MNYTQNQKISQVTETTLIVGVDIGSETNFARAFNWRGQELSKKVFRFNNSREGFQSFLAYINTYTTIASAQQIRVVYNPDYKAKLFISSELLTDSELGQYFPGRTAVFYTAEPEKLDALAEELGIKLYANHAFYRAQDDALETIQTQKGTKGIIVCALVLLLGVNLYSSFSNALNERKFEIGVKRAIGASSFSIVRQFLYESILVMAVNILLSIAIVVDLGLVWKLVMERLYAGQEEFADKYWDFILYLSPHSIAMFAVSTVTLTVVFSLIFAYKSTQVEIVQYLKAE